MTRQLDIDRILDGFLAEGTQELADRVLDAALNDIDSTKQRRAWWPPRRYAYMNTYAKAGLAAVAVIAVAIAGYNLLPGIGGVGAGPTPTPSPSARPVGDGAMDPGRYYIDDPARTPVRISFTVPAGWSARASDKEISKEIDSTRWMNFWSTVVTHVYTDACLPEGELTPIGPTVDDLITALTGQGGSDASVPEDISLGGYAGKRITMTIPADLDTGTCRNPDLLIQVWANEAETSFFAIPIDPPGVEGTVYILDVDGDRVVLHAGGSPGASPADIAELEGILASIKFGS